MMGMVEEGCHVEQDYRITESFENDNFRDPMQRGNPNRSKVAGVGRFSRRTWIPGWLVATDSSLDLATPQS